MEKHRVKSWPCELVEHDYLQAGEILSQTPPEERASVVFADPPYNLGIQYADDPTGDKLTLDRYQDFVLSTLSCLVAAGRPGGTLWWMCPPEHADWIGDMLTRMIGPRMYMVVWEEAFAQYQGDRALTKDFRLLYCHRFTTSQGEVTFNPNDIRVPSARQEVYKDKRANPLGRVPGCVWKFRRLQGTSHDHVDWHPCQLPPEILSRIVKGWSNKDDLVVDAFVGSGSLARVCHKLGRRFVGVDRSKTYIEKLAEELA